MMVLPPAAVRHRAVREPPVAYDLGVYSQRYGLPPARLKSSTTAAPRLPAGPGSTTWPR